MYERLSQKLDTFREQQLTACQLVLKAFLKMYSSTPQGFDIVKIVRQLQIDNQAKGKYEESFVVTKHLKVTVSFSEENCHLQLLESTNKFLFQNARSKYFQNSLFFNRSFMLSEAQSDVIQQHILRVVNNARNEVNIISSWGGTTIAQVIRPCLPSYGPGFESQAHHLSFYIVMFSTLMVIELRK